MANNYLNTEDALKKMHVKFILNPNAGKTMDFEFMMKPMFRWRLYDKASLKNLECVSLYLKKKGSLITEIFGMPMRTVRAQLIKEDDDIKYCDGDAFYIYRIATIKRHQRKGYAAITLKRYMGHIKYLHGVNDVFVHANELSEPLFSSYGFKKLYEVDDWCGSGDCASFMVYKFK